MRTFLTKHSSHERDQIALNKIKNKKQLTILACDIARSVLPFWLNQFPDDVTVLNLIQTTEDFIFGLTDLDQLTIARDNAYHVCVASKYNTFSLSAYNASNVIYRLPYAAYNAAKSVANASYNNPNQWNNIYKLYQQTFKPNHIIIPKNPIFLEIANEIKSTRNFKLYNILTDAILDYSNIKINTKCLGLSNWLLFHLLLKD